MSLDSLLRPFHGPALRHIPYKSPFDVLDFRFAALASDNRWNYQGSPTLYLASDGAVALAEFARHFQTDRAGELAPQAVRRVMFQLQVSLEHVLDVRDHSAHAALSLGNAPACFLDKALARATATFVRTTTEAQAILAPSIAMLDQPGRWVMVVFLEKLLPDPAQFLRPATLVAEFEVSQRGRSDF